MTTVLVTGASGYVGGRLAQHWASEGALLLKVTSRDPKRLAFLRGSSVTAHALSPADTAEDLETLLDGIDVVVHLAGMSAVHSAQDPVAAADVNVAWTGRLVRAAHAREIRRFVYLSTIHVYGPLIGTLSEHTVPRPVHPYATSRRAAEEVVLAAGESGWFETVVVRLSNVVGPPASIAADCWGLVANDLCRQAVTSRQLVLRSAGATRRDFIGMRQVLASLDRLTREPPSPGKKNVLLNLASGQTVSLADLAAIIRERSEALLGFVPPLSMPATGDAAVVPFSVDVSRLKELKLASEFDIREEIDATLRFLRERRQA
jgi:UDP-glucose 4-epimerase